MLGMLALLLGFSFAGASSRFNSRTDLIVKEANAMTTVWLRGDLLCPPSAKELRELLARYLDLRITAYDAADDEAHSAATAAAEAIQSQIWTVALAGAKSDPQLGFLLLTPVGELFDAYGARLAATHRHLPGMLLGLLLVSSAVAVAAVGYCCGVAGKRNGALTTALCFLIAGVLWAIVDMDHPRRGLIEIGQQPLLDLQQQFGKPTAGAH